MQQPRPGQRGPAGPGGDHRARPGTGGQQLGRGPRRDRVVQDHQQPPPGAQPAVAGEPPSGVPGYRLPSGQAPQQVGQDLAEGAGPPLRPGQAGEGGPVGEAVPQRVRGPDGQRGLAGPGRARDDDRRGGALRGAARSQPGGQVGQVPHPPGEVGQVGREGRGGLGRCGRRGRAGLAPQDRLEGAVQHRAGVHPELVGDQRPPGAVGLQRVGLAPAPVQRGHELGAQPLAQRMLLHQRGELLGGPPVAAQRQVGLGAVLHRGQARPGQLRRLGLGERPGGPLQRAPGPLLQRRRQVGRGLAVVPALQGGAPQGRQPGEVPQVDGGVGDLEGVAARPALQLRAGAEDLAQPGDVGVDLRGHRGRRAGAPQGPAQPVHGHGGAVGQEERGERRRRLGAAERHALPVPEDLHGSQDAYLHAANCVPRPAAPPRCAPHTVARPDGCRAPRPGRPARAGVRPGCAGATAPRPRVVVRPPV